MATFVYSILRSRAVTAKKSLSYFWKPFPLLTFVLLSQLHIVNY